jgi:hypothetical protein
MRLKPNFIIFLNSGSLCLGILHKKETPLISLAFVYNIFIDVTHIYKYARKYNLLFNPLKHKIHAVIFNNIVPTASLRLGYEDWPINAV